MSARDDLVRMMMAQQPAETNPYAGIPQQIMATPTYVPGASSFDNIGASFLQGFAGGLFGRLSQEREQKIQNDRLQKGFEITSYLEDYDRRAKREDMLEEARLKASFEPPKQVGDIAYQFDMESNKYVPVGGTSSSRWGVSGQPQGYTPAGTPGVTAPGQMAIAQQSTNPLDSDIAIYSHLGKQAEMAGVPKEMQKDYVKDQFDRAKQLRSSITGLKNVIGQYETLLPEIGDTGGGALGSAGRAGNDLLAYLTGADSSTKLSAARRQFEDLGAASLRQIKSMDNLGASQLNSIAEMRFTTGDLPSLDKPAAANKASIDMLKQRLAAIEDEYGSIYGLKQPSQAQAPSASPENESRAPGNALTAAMIQAESSGNPNAVSPKGARGLMQLMPATFAEVKKKYGLEGSVDDPETNVKAGELYFNEQMQTFGGNIELALAAYNAGPGTVQDAMKAAGVSDPRGVRWADIAAASPQSKEHRAETLGYVAKITGKLGQDQEAKNAAYAKSYFAGLNEKIKQGTADPVEVENATKEALAEPNSAVSNVPEVQEFRSLVGANPPQQEAQQNQPGAVSRFFSGIGDAAKAVYSDPAGAVSTVADTATFGLMDEGLEAVGLPSDTYKQDITRFAEQNPGTAIGAQVAGGFLNPASRLFKGAGLLKSLGIGAGEGALYGAGSAEGGAAERVAGAAKGGAVGLAGGATVAGVTKGAQKVGQLATFLSDRTGLTDVALRTGRKLFREAGAVGSDIGEVAGRGAKKTTLPGNAESRRGVKQALRSQAELSLDDAKAIKATLDEAAESGVKELTIADIMSSEQMDKGVQLARTSRNFLPSDQGSIGAKLKKRSDEGIQRAEKILDEITPEKDVIKASSKFKETLNKKIEADNKLRNEASGKLYQEYFEKNPRIKGDVELRSAGIKADKNSPYQKLKQLHKSGQFVDALNKARESMNMSKLPKGEVETSTKVLHKARRYLDDALAGAENPIAGIQRTEAGAIKKVRSEVDDILARVDSPEDPSRSLLKQADEAYKNAPGALPSIDDQEFLKNLASGENPVTLVKQLMTKSPEEVEKLANLLGPEGDEALTVALRSALKQQFTDPGNTSRLAKVVQGPAFQSRLKTILGETKASKLIRSLEFEDMMIQGKNATNKGSSTFGNAKSTADLLGATDTLVDFLAAAGGSPQAIMRSGGKLSKAFEFIADRTNKKGYELLSDSLFDQEKGRRLLDWYITELEKQQRKAKGVNRAIGSVSRTTGREKSR